MSIRNKRLENDYRALQKVCAFHEPEKIIILETQGTPLIFIALKSLIAKEYRLYLIM
jgi:hypothetical protein